MSYVQYSVLASAGRQLVPLWITKTAQSLTWEQGPRLVTTCYNREWGDEIRPWHEPGSLSETEQELGVRLY